MSLAYLLALVEGRGGREGKKTRKERKRRRGEMYCYGFWIWFSREGDLCFFFGWGVDDEDGDGDGYIDYVF